MEVDFSTIFKVHADDGSIEPLRTIQISGVKIAPGIRFTPGVKFGGIDFTLYTDKKLEVEEVEDSGVSSVIGIYG